MLLILGGLVPSAFLIPNTDLSLRILDMPSTWQVASILYCSLVFSSDSAVISAIAYIVIGTFYLPVFHGGGSSGYITTPEFGYLIGFIPSSFITSFICRARKRKTYLNLLYSSIIGLMVIHMTGIINLILGSFANRWSSDIITMLFTYTLGPLPFQLLLCTSIALFARISRILILYNE